MYNNSEEKVKIAVFGAAKEPKSWTWYGWPSVERRHTEDLGVMLGTAFGSKIEILTGACIGVPDQVAEHARRHGTRVIGYSGKTNLEEHLKDPNYADPNHFDELKFMDPKDVVLNGLIERSMRMINDADALIFLGGRTGTLGEYAIAYDGSKKPMYCLLGSGGTIDKIAKSTSKKPRNGLVYQAWTPLDIVKRLDHDFQISNFERDPDFQIIYTQSPISAVQFAYDGFDKNKKAIFVR
jgi:predicted Rossmann-fold nucleotide-binding protein